MSPQKRSSTGHFLLPASEPPGTRETIPFVPSYNAFSWTFGRGTVIWNIWPAVVLHTLFAAVVTTLSLETDYYLAVPPVLITVLGVVIGFVIAYRASSGYDRYWMGRCCWSDLIKTTRTISRLIWIHVPLRLQSVDPAIPHAPGYDHETSLKIMQEKRLALELIEGLLVAIKHHLRGEMGIYYEDLYPLVKPFHIHHHHTRSLRSRPSSTQAQPTTDTSTTALKSQNPDQAIAVPISDPPVPAMNEYSDYGTFCRRRGSRSSYGSGDAKRPFLFPSTQPRRRTHIHADLVPFSGLFSSTSKFMKRTVIMPWRFLNFFTNDIERDDMENVISNAKAGKAPRSVTNRKFKPMVAGGGENLPLEILRCLSEWVEVLDSRNVLSGNTLGGLYSCLAAYEDSLSALERILTTPLPFIYSAHIRQCVWTYLFLLPFQLVEQFGWSTVPGVGVAAFFYLGFLAAGEEIEQPFGYDENDLPLDLFCDEIVHNELCSLRLVRCKNSVTERSDQPQRSSLNGRYMYGRLAGNEDTAVDSSDN